jgi:hypothetical protein
MTSYQQRIKEKILEINFYMVREITQLDEIITVEYNTSNLCLPHRNSKKGDYKRMTSLNPIQNLFGGYIYLSFFRRLQ